MGKINRYQRLETQPLLSSSGATRVLVVVAVVVIFKLVVADVSSCVVGTIGCHGGGRIHVATRTCHMSPGSDATDQTRHNILLNAFKLTIFTVANHAASFEAIMHF
jgi:hypothetical protein